MYASLTIWMVFHDPGERTEADCLWQTPAMMRTALGNAVVLYDRSKSLKGP